MSRYDQNFSFHGFYITLIETNRKFVLAGFCFP